MTDCRRLVACRSSELVEPQRSRPDQIAQLASCGHLGFNLDHLVPVAEHLPESDLRPAETGHGATRSTRPIDETYGTERSRSPVWYGDVFHGGHLRCESETVGSA